MLTLLHALAMTAIGLLFGFSGHHAGAHHGVTVHAFDTGGTMPGH